MGAYETPMGTLHVAVTPEDETVRAAGLRPAAQVAAHLPVVLGKRGWMDGEVDIVTDAVVGWLDGDPSRLGAVAVQQPGGPFFREVWARMREIPAGETASYQELARMAGRPRAMRAVGTACARNAIALFVPCHRVINAGGRLGSYGFGGTDVKATMLAHEGVTVARGRGADAVVVPAGGNPAASVQGRRA